MAPTPFRALESRKPLCYEGVPFLTITLLRHMVLFYNTWVEHLPPDVAGRVGRTDTQSSIQEGAIGVVSKWPKKQD